MAVFSQEQKRSKSKDVMRQKRKYIFKKKLRKIQKQCKNINTYIGENPFKNHYYQFKNIDRINLKKSILKQKLSETFDQIENQGKKVSDMKMLVSPTTKKRRKYQNVIR